MESLSTKNDSKFYYLSRHLLTKQDSLPRPLVRSESDFFQPLHTNQIPRSWLAQPHGPISPQFLDRFLSASLDRKEELRIGFREFSKMHELRERTLLEVAGTVLAAQLAWKHGVATNAAGGTHHAHADMGAGYTIINDLAVAANFLLNEDLNGGTVKGVKKVFVIDCDVHQGDGTAKFGPIFNGNGNKSGVDVQNDLLITLSMHCDSNYPSYKAHSSYDVPLPDKMGDEEYLKVLKENVERALEETKPDFVFYDAGVDVHKDDLLGRLWLSDDGIRARDRWVIERCVKDGIPVAAVIGGGYDKDETVLARRHAIVHEQAAYVWRKYKMWSR